jgi:exopolyphosphatase/guanosine-5'-triphosphate,3'-diphosphate pyrophosphatase
MTTKKAATVAVIHLGSEMVSMQIVEYTDLNKMKVLEQVRQKVTLGEETFKNRKISFSTTLAVCDILKGYRRLMADYGVTNYVLQATTAIREAQNQDYFLDQIYVKTGLKIEVIDMPREIFIKNVSLQRTLAQYEKKFFAQGILFVDISSGGLGITYMNNGIIKYQQNLHIGIIRIKEAFDRNEQANINFAGALTEYIASNIGPAQEELSKEKIKYFVLTGAESELILQLVNKNSNPKKLAHLAVEDFTAFYNKVKKLNTAQIMKLYGLEENQAELVLPTTILYQQLLNLTPAEEILVPPDAFIDGMKTLYVARETDPEFIEYLRDLRMSLVHSVGEHFHYDAKHAKCVEKFAMAIFDKLKKSQGLDAHARLLLRAACLLHDVGKFVCLRSHAIYSYRLIISTDFFGFGYLDKSIIALISLYQGDTEADKDKIAPIQIDKEIRPLVAKLSAILRLADAMDRSYKQKIKSCKVTVSENEMLVTAKSKQDLSLEEWTFANKGSYFEEVFGLMPVLEKAEG